MSRHRRLKERKNRIKSASCALALALVIGSGQGLGTYALFTDNEDIVSNLAISTGDIDVYSTEGFKGKDIGEKGYISKNFEIINKGTLKQKLQIELTTKTKISDEALKNITFKLSMSHGGKIIKPIDLNFYKIKQGEKFNLEYDTGGKVILNSGDKIDCVSQVSIKNLSKHNVEKQKIDFDLNILASQISYKSGTIDQSHNGFIDLYTQVNSFLINQSDLDNVESNLDVELDDHKKQENYEIDIKAPKGKKIKSVVIELGTGEFNRINLCERESDGFDIIKNPLSEFVLGPGGIDTEYSDNQKLVVRVKFKSGEEEIWEIKFRYRDKLQAYYIKLEEVPKEGIELLNNLDVEEFLKEDEELSSNPEVVDPPKEEVIAPDKPELVEPSKQEEVIQSEQEIIELQKKEVVEPSKLDTIQQSKEDLEIQK